MASLHAQSATFRPGSACRFYVGLPDGPKPGERLLAAGRADVAEFPAHEIGQQTVEADGSVALDPSPVPVGTRALLRGVGHDGDALYVTVFCKPFRPEVH